MVLIGQDIESNWDKRIANLVDSLSQNQTKHLTKSLLLFYTITISLKSIKNILKSLMMY